MLRLRITALVALAVPAAAAACSTRTIPDLLRKLSPDFKRAPHART